jgi:hypothetical protein
MYDMRSKMLSFYFTFFEILTANRSYVVMVLKEHNNQLKKLALLSGLRNSYKKFLNRNYLTILERNKNDFKISRKTFIETSWIQLLLTMKFG